MQLLALLLLCPSPANSFTAPGELGWVSLSCLLSLPVSSPPFFLRFTNSPMLLVAEGCSMTQLTHWLTQRIQFVLKLDNIIMYTKWPGSPECICLSLSFAQHLYLPRSPSLPLSLSFVSFLSGDCEAWWRMHHSFMRTNDATTIITAIIFIFQVVFYHSSQGNISTRSSTLSLYWLSVRVCKSDQVRLQLQSVSRITCARPAARPPNTGPHWLFHIFYPRDKRTSKHTMRWEEEEDKEREKEKQ